MDDSNGLDDEITIDPLPTPSIPIPRAVRMLAGRVPLGWRAGSGRRLTWRDWLLVAIAATVVIGALKLAGVIWASAPPKWVPALGTGVTVTGPEQVAPGHDSPGAVLVGFLAALSSRAPASACEYAYVDAGSVASCKAELRRVQHDQLPYGVSVKIGYVATEGTRALVGVTGSICEPRNTPRCVSNADPAAIFSTRNTFTTLWDETTNSPSPGNGYALLPCVEVGGKWYVGPDPTEGFS